MEGAFCFVVSGSDDSIEKFLRCLSEGYEKFSLSVLSPDKTRKAPTISITCQTEYMRAQLKEFLAGCPSRPAGGGCPQVPNNK
jgi:hypothetical protein